MTVALVCTESGDTNYYTSINKAITPKLEIKKYCPKLRKHTIHKSREKLK
ncbi:MAG: 50S ribosomal protein L33 [bacterium]|nr:50S ribosomal protein L33 [bacterium]